MFLYFFLMPLVTTVFFIVALYPYALKIDFTDKPSHRKQHQNHTPLIGGIAVYLTVIVAFFFTDNSLSNQTPYIAAATLLVCVGLIDDYKGLGVKVRVLVQIAAGLIMVEFAHIKIIDLGNLLGGGNIQLSYFATAFTLFAVVGGINAFNMIDGIDGLAGSLILILIASITSIFGIFQDWIFFKFGLIFIASILGFLLFNLRIFGQTSAKIFLGDTGSTLLGFTACWLLIEASQGEKKLISPVTVLWLMAVPLCDSVCIMLRRIRKGRSPFLPDREHFHHVFHIAGFSVNQTLGMILSLSFILSFIGIAVPWYFTTPDSVLFSGFMLLFISYYWLINHAWRIIKIFRYLQVTKLFDRRVKNQKIEIDRRSNVDRRYIPSEQEIKKIETNKGFSPIVLLGKHFRTNSKR